MGKIRRDFILLAGLLPILSQYRERSTSFQHNYFSYIIGSVSWKEEKLDSECKRKGGDTTETENLMVWGFREFQRVSM